MFAGWGSQVARLRWPVLIVALVAVIGSGIWGFGVFGQLTEGGYNDPGSESARAAETAAAASGGQDGDVIAIYTPDQGGTIDDAALTKRIKERLASLPKSAVAAHSSYWDSKAPAFAAEDRSSAVAIISLTGETDADKMKAYREIEDDLAVDGARVQPAGGIPLGSASSERSTDDLAFAEMVSLPIVLVLLLVIFGSLVAASLPVLVGGAAVLGSLGVLHVVALTHEVNSFAINVASLLGLGMAIDYGLFMVGRFREEQAVHDTAEAVRRTVATAGRTVVFSATLLMTALAGLLLFPQGFLKSLAYGGLAAVFLAMLLSLTLLPALLAVLGPRVDLVPIRLPRYSRGDGRGWERLAERVLRRPVLVAVPIFAALVVLALPIADARFGENDERQLPAGDPSRVAIETLKADYPQFGSDGVQVVVQAAAGQKPDVKAFSQAVGEVTGVESVTPTGGDGKDVVVLTVDLTGTDVFSDEARDTVDALRALPAPAGAEVLVGGVTARNVDSLEAISAELPLMIGLLTGATLVLMFLAFGSVLLPIKAVVMSALSLTATFGALVWIFQEGNGASLLNVTPTPLEAGIVVLMAAVVFGLSTDYEVFLLSRMVEARLRGATTHQAVTIGLTRTGRVISAAALLLIVVTGAFSLSSVTTMRFIGVGMIIALVLDATVVRVLLVPAVLAVLGDAVWWAPGPLRRLQEKAGLAEHAGEEEVSGRHAWRPVDPSLEETTVLDGTLMSRALPAAPAQNALTSGSSVSTEAPSTVVLDYDAVLGYLSDKEGAAARAGGLLPERSLSPAGTTTDAPEGPGRHRDPDTSPEEPESTGVLTAATHASAAGGASSTDDLWAEVEATLAAGAEITKPDPETGDGPDPARTHVLRLPGDPADGDDAKSATEPPAGTSVTQVPHLPDSGAATSPAPDEPGASPAPEVTGSTSDTAPTAASELASGGTGVSGGPESSADGQGDEAPATVEGAAAFEDVDRVAADESTGAGSSPDAGTGAKPAASAGEVPVSADGAEAAATDTATAPADWSAEPSIFSATVYTGLFTEETVRAATPDPAEETDAVDVTGAEEDRAAVLASPASVEDAAQDAAEDHGGEQSDGGPSADPDARDTAEPTGPAEGFTSTDPPLPAAEETPEPAGPPAPPPASPRATAVPGDDGSGPGTAPERPESTEDPAPFDAAEAALFGSPASASFEAAWSSFTATGDEPVTQTAAVTHTEPVTHTAAVTHDGPATDDVSVDDDETPAHDSPADLEESAARTSEAEDSATPVDGLTPAGAGDTPDQDPFSWRADPRLADLSAPDPFPWLDRFGAVKPVAESPAAKPAADLPHPQPERVGRRRPQTLDDLLAAGPQAPAAAGLASSSAARPESLEDLPAATSPAARRDRPRSLADLPARPAEAGTTADEPTPAGPPAGTTATVSGQSGPVTAGSEPVGRPRSLEDAPASRSPEDVPAAPTTGTGSRPVAPSGPHPTDPERHEPEYLRGRRPETLDDRLRGTVRPSTLADHLPERGRGNRHAANGGPAWAGESGEHPYDRQTRRPASLADHPGPVRPAPEPSSDTPDPGPAH